MSHLSRQRESSKEGEKVKDYTNSQISALIDEHVHNARDRDILKRRMIDGLCYEPLAEEFGLSTQGVKAICYKWQSKIVAHL